MFCGKCGTKNNDNVEFCVNCGAKLNKSKSTQMDSVSTLGQNDKNRKVGIIAVAAAIVIIALIGILLFGGRSYKSTIKKYVEASFDADVESVLDLIPDEMITYLLKEEDYDPEDFEEIKDDMKEEFQDQLAYLDKYLGEEWEISYEIVGDESLKDDDLEDIKTAYEDADFKVSAAKNVKVEITMKSNETETSNNLDIHLIKSGRSWYLDVMNMGNLF